MQWSELNPEEARTWEDWETWHNTARKLMPVNYFFRMTAPGWFRRKWFLITDFWYRTKCYWWNRYNVVVCKSLPPTWVDRDHLLLHTSFQILKDFVEEERDDYVFMPREEILEVYGDCGDQAANERADKYAEIRALYEWWQDRSKKEKNLDGGYVEDTVMLKRLADVREYLWT